MVDAGFSPFTLEGKILLVTGASSGIGQAIAIACSRMGATIIVVGRNQERLQETFGNLYGEQSHQALLCDLSDEVQAESMVRQLPKLDGVVHCAGVGHRKPCKMIEAHDVDYVLNANFKTIVLLQSQLLQKKRINADSSIVILASRAAQAPSMGNAMYSASKGALLSYAKCLALELAPRRIRVNCICPAMVWTPLIMQGVIDEEQLKEAEQRYPLKRYGRPDDVAYLAIYLLSDASSWMTGAELDITGGAEGLLTL